LNPSSLAQPLAWFVAGAAAAGLVCFDALRFAARLMTPRSAKPGAWTLLDCIIGITAWLLGSIMPRKTFAALRGVWHVMGDG